MVEVTGGLAGAFVTGLLGSLHCAGMCGPLAVAVGAARGGSAAGRLWLFVCGKTGTYAVLGLAAGVVGAALGQDGLGARAGGVLAIVAGSAMIALGARTLWRRRGSASSGGPGAVGVLMAHVLRRGGPHAPLLAGALAGLLPCGMVHAMLAHALAQGSAAGGVAVMLAFGAGTAPSLLAAGLVAARAGQKWRDRAEPLAAAAIIMMGAMTLARGVALITAGPASAACCHPA